MDIKVLFLVVLFAFARAQDDTQESLSQLLQGEDEQESSQDLLSQLLQGEGEQEEAIEQEDDDDSEVSEDCQVAEVEQCLSHITSLLSNLADTDEKSACDAMISTYNCLKSKADSCLEGDDRDEVQSDLDQMKNILEENCNFKEEEQEEPEKSSEAEQCINREAEYLQGCIMEGVTQVLNLAKSGVHDKDAVRCTTYGLIADCFVERTLEKCGQEAAEEFREHMADMPEEIKSSCDAAGGTQELFGLQLLDSKK